MMGDEKSRVDVNLPSEFPFSDEELDASIKVINYFKENEGHKRLAETSPKLLELFKLIKESFVAKKKSAHPRTARASKKEKDLVLLDDTGIRLERQLKVVAERKIKIVGYPGGFRDLPIPPREGSLLANAAFCEENDEIIREELQQLTAGNKSLENEQSPKGQANDKQSKVDQPRLLNFSRNCHICGSSFKQVDIFYDQLCPSCCIIHHEKRTMKVDMRDKICLVTGARVKIGYCVALKLLRMGAFVVVTTRFPHDAAIRYATEEDFEDWKGRLVIYGLDFRDIKMVDDFCLHIKKTLPRLDVIINNAAQTVRRPPSYYAHLLQVESTPLPKSIIDAIQVLDAQKNRNGDGSYVFQTMIENSDIDGVMNSSNVNFSNTSAMFSQLSLVSGDEKDDESIFPAGLYDRDDQQVDLRTENSWTQEITSVSTIEMVECHMINTFAPWVIISNLVPFLKATLSEKYIVNVSAMEGQFYRPKSHLHPHTNMAKAALNMMTRTASVGLMRDRIYMTAVDTGWITDENPVGEWDKRKNNPPPLDDVDAAARILDPVLMGVKAGEDGEKMWGVFLKNYIPTRW